jgi:hypothetical protein
VRPWNTEGKRLEEKKAVNWSEIWNIISVSIARAFNLARDANGTASDQPITRRRIIERGVYTFVASLFPSYGHDPRIAEAFDNAQQDEVREFMKHRHKKKKMCVNAKVISQ